MSSEIIKRDQNHATVGAGISSTVDTEVVMLRVDPVTKRLLVDLDSIGSTPGIASEIASRDQNHRTVCMGWDETNQVLQEILTDEAGRILCDVEFV